MSGPAAGVPVDPGREEARRLAERELADPAYEDEPPLLERVLTWLADRVSDLLAGAGSLSPGRWLALLVLTAVLGALALALVRRLGQRARVADRSGEVFASAPRTAAEHLAAADAAASRGDWPTAVAERFRGAVRRLEERGVLDPAPGRTAEEVAAEAGRLLPVATAALQDGARRFDRVRYGGSSASAADDTALRALVALVSTGRAERAPGAAATSLAVPR